MANRIVLEGKSKEDIILGFKIKLFMTNKNIKPKELAKQISVTPTTIYNTVNGSRRCPETRDRVANALGFNSWNKLKEAV